jgi:hypothetical protein
VLSVELVAESRVGLLAETFADFLSDGMLSGLLGVFASEHAVDLLSGLLGLDWPACEPAAFDS